MILKKKDILVQLGQYQKGQILFYNKKTKSLLAMDEKASYRSMGQLTLANSYVVGYAILAFKIAFIITLSMCHELLCLQTAKLTDERSYFLRC